MQQLAQENEDILSKEREREGEDAKTDSDEPDVPVRVPYNIARTLSE